LRLPKLGFGFCYSNGRLGEVQFCFFGIRFGSLELFFRPAAHGEAHLRSLGRAEIGLLGLVVVHGDLRSANYSQYLPSLHPISFINKNLVQVTGDLGIKRGFLDGRHVAREGYSSPDILPLRRGSFHGDWSLGGLGLGGWSDGRVAAAAGDY